MEAYKKMVEQLRDEKIANLPRSGSGGISPRRMAEKLQSLQDNIKSLDDGLVEMGTKYWKDRKDFNKDDVQKLHADAINDLVGAFKKR